LDGFPQADADLEIDGLLFKNFEVDQRQLRSFQLMRKKNG
jgi:hypothetical protein